MMRMERIGGIKQHSKSDDNPSFTCLNNKINLTHQSKTNQKQTIARFPQQIKYKLKIH
jgi:hypothetical protein